MIAACVLVGEDGRAASSVVCAFQPVGTGKVKCSSSGTWCLFFLFSGRSY